MDNVEHMKAALSYNYDDQNLWCCFVTCGSRRANNALSPLPCRKSSSRSPATRSHVRPARDKRSGRTPGARAMTVVPTRASVVWEYGKFVGVATSPPPPAPPPLPSSTSSSSSSSSAAEYEYQVRRQAKPDAPPRTVTKLRVQPQWQHKGAFFVQPSRGLWREDHRGRHGRAAPARHSGGRGEAAGLLGCSSTEGGLGEPSACRDSSN